MSATTEPGTKLTPEDLLALPDGERFELVDGDLLERNVSNLSSLVALEGGALLRDHDRGEGRFWTFGADCGYRCFDDPKKVRRPDVTCLGRERWPAGRLGEGYVLVAPDLAVEVLSPNDNAIEVETKVEDYLGAGTRLVWIVNPDLRTVRVHRADGSASVLRAADELTGEGVLPGFRCRVGDLFPAG